MFFSFSHFSFSHSHYFEVTDENGFPIVFFSSKNGITRSGLMMTCYWQDKKSDESSLCRMLNKFENGVVAISSSMS